MSLSTKDMLANMNAKSSGSSPSASTQSANAASSYTPQQSQGGGLTTQQMLASMNTGKQSTSTTSPAQVWSERVKALYNSYNNYYGGDYKTGKEASAWGASYGKQASLLMNEGQKYKGQYGTETDSYIDELLSIMQSSQSDAQNLGDYFGQFKNAEDYTTSQDVQKALETGDDYSERVTQANENVSQARQKKQDAFWDGVKRLFSWQGGTVNYEDTYAGAKDDFRTAQKERDHAVAVQGTVKGLNDKSAAEKKWAEQQAQGISTTDLYTAAESNYYTATDEIQSLTTKRNAVQTGAAQYADDGTYMGEKDVSDELAEIDAQIAKAQQRQHDASTELSIASSHMGLGDYEALASGLSAEDNHSKERAETYNKAIYGLTTENIEAEAKAAPDFAKLATPSVEMQSKWLFSDQVDIDYDYINKTYENEGKTQFTREYQERQNQLNEITDEEKAVFNALYASDKEKASDYLDRLMYRLNERISEKSEKELTEFATEKPVLASALSVPASLASGAGFVDIALQHATRDITGEYKPIDYNTNNMAFNQASSVIRGTRAQNLADKYGYIELDAEEHPVLAPILNGKNVGDVYSLGMSMVDSLAVAGIGKAAGAAGSLSSKLATFGGTSLLGGAAGTQGVLDALDRGATDEQALMMGIANATFETLFEYVSIDKLVNTPKATWAATFQQAGIEGSEEFFTTVANTVADVAIMRENSDFKQTVQKYIEQGMSAEDAEKAATKDLCVQLWWDFAGGAVMGGLSSATVGATSAAVQGISDNMTYKGTGAQSVESILPAVRAQATEDYYPADMKTESGDKTHFLAGQPKRMTELVSAVSNVESKLEAGARITQGDMRKIQGALSEHQRASVKRMAEIALEEAEVGGDTSKTATQITELIMDGTTSSELEFLAQSNDKYAAAVEKVISQVVEIADNAQTTESATQAETTGEDNTGKTASIEDFAANYEGNSGNVVEIYNQESGQDVTEFSTAFEAAYDMGNSGLSESYATGSTSTQYLSEAQRKAAWSMGHKASTAQAAKSAGAIATGKKTGENIVKKGSVKGEGVSISDLTKTLNDPQRKAYKMLTFLSDSLGVDIVLTNDTSTTTDADGKEVFKGEQGKFSRKDGKIYIAVNAGLYYTSDVGEFSKYTMLRTFSHEFTHFIEAWNPEQYNELRRVVFDTLTQQGKNVDDLIEQVQAQSDNMSYDAASREVVAEAMTDILPDSKFIETLANKHQRLYEKILEKLKEFYQRLKDAWSGMQRNPSAAANALKTEIDGTLKYMDSIIQAFDKAAAGAVENYQATTGTEQIGIMDEEQAGEVAVAENATTTSEENTANNDTFEDRLKAEGYTEAEISAAVKQHDEHPMRNQEETQEERESSIEAILNFKRSYDPAKEPREITSSTYQRAQKRLDKEVANFVGARQTPVTPQNTAGATKAQDVKTTSQTAQEATAATQVKQAQETAQPDATTEKSAAVEEAKKKLHKAVRLPIQTTNEEALIAGIKSGELTADSITITGKYAGMSTVQQETLIDALIEGAQTESETIKVDVPYDGTFEILNTPASVAKVLARLKVKATQEILFDKKLDAILSSATNVATGEYNGTYYISNGYVVMATTAAGAEYAANEDTYKAKSFDFGKFIKSSVEGKKFEPVTTQPVFAKKQTKTGLDIYIFTMPDGSQFALQKKYVDYFAGNKFSVTDYSVNGPFSKLVKVENDDGDIQGYIFSVRPANRKDFKAELSRAVPANLKSFSEKPNNSKKGKQPELSNNIVAETEHTPETNAENTDAEEVNSNGRENGRVSDINSTLDAGSDGERAPRLLEEVQNGNVSGDAQGRNASSGASERGGQAQQSGSGPDNGKRTGRGSGEGDSQSADIRRDGGLSPEDKATADESLHEVVTQQIEQRSTEKPKGSNYVIGDSLNLPSGDKARYKANIDAIRLVKQLEAEGRTATAAEQEILSKYVGWGGLANAFGEERYNRELHKSESVAKTGWEKEFAELREALTDDEYKAARASTNNAHYTDISVIRGMYSGLKRLGFTGGRMLEPSSGVGNFVGAMPADMSSTVKSWTMVELDNITGLIAKHLYPNADVRIQGFEKANIPDNYMDVAIGNVPFGNYAITDRAYPTRVKSAIHNYFFAKSIDKVRPGGVVMFITSSFTMSSKDNAVRRYISERADLLGAIRLPGGAFKENAGTDVVTDILILKKRAAGTEYAGQAFVNTEYTTIDDYSELQNEYFMAHPEMVLGTPTHTRGMYGSNTLTYAPLEGKGNLAEQIDAAFSNIKGKMDYSAVQSPDKTNFAVERSLKKPKQGSLTVRSDGKAYRDEDGTPVEISSDKAKVEKISGIISIRDSYRTLATALQQKQNESSVKAARKALNTAYDAFVAKYGFLNKPQNRSTILLDPDSYSILSLETYNAETKTGVKADIFKKDTISPNRTITSVEDVKTGVIVSVNETGGIDVPLIAKLTGKTQEAVTRELLDGRLAYKNSDGILEAPETYLAGNVRAKLREAEARAPLDKDYESNVAALKAVIPEDIPYQDIYVVPGAPWVPANVYADFIAHMLGGVNRPNSYSGPDVVVKRSNETGNFTIDIRNSRLKSGYRNIQTWGTKERHFTTLIDSLMASRSVTVRYKTADGSYVVDKVATAAANEKLELITSEFQKWLWSDEARAKELATLYNETFNAIVNPKYKGENLTVNGANPAKPLRAHQRDAVQRIISSGGNTLLAHKVGAGKTYEMAAAAMKLRQLGLVKKPVFVVPKSLVAQWGTEFKDFFPVAKLLVADEKSFTASNRKVFVNQIANGDYDAIILSYEQFEKIPMSADFQREFYQEQIDEVISAIAEEKEESGGRSLSIKDMEKKRKQLQAKIDKLTDKAKDEDNTEFDRLGIDSLFVDEAHNFKNLEYVSRMSNIAGLSNPNGAKRSFDLYTKVRYLQKMNGGRGIVFATATPVMNSMSELYIMQKYLQSDRLKQLGLSTFDAWAKQFGEVVNTTEIKPSGQGFRVKQVFSRFRNLSELQLLFRSFSDVLTDIPGLKVPTMKGGKVNVVVCEPSQFQKDFMLQLEERADNIKNVDPSVDNMLKITSDGRKVAYTQRMIDPSLPYEEGCKIYRCCDNVAAAWNASATFTGADGKAYKNGTQLIFCDMATPKGKKGGDADSEDDNDGMDMENARLYDDIKARLIKKGIPAKQIAFIHEADTDAKKKKLFADMNDGVIRVLIGSTGKMGVGMNAQRRIVAIHHLDAPWRPGDVEQRNGRAYRQGNLNAEVEDFTYVTEGSFDARLWDILDRKSKFINQIMEGNDVGRSAEDTGNVTLSAAEVKALASGNPLIMEQVQLSNDIQKLENLSRAHTSDVLTAKRKLTDDESAIAALQRSISNGQADIKARTTGYLEESFSMTVGKKTYSTKKDAGAALIKAILANATEDGYTTVGSFAGFELRAIKIGLDYKGLIFGKQGYEFNVHIGNPTFMVGQISASIEGLPGKVEKWQNALDDTIADKNAQETIISSGFAKKDELDQKRARFNEVMAILNPVDEQDLDSLDEGEDVEEQYQSRRYANPVEEWQDECNAFRANIDEWSAEGKPAGERFILGSTGEVIQGLGAIETDIYIQGDKIKTILNDHPEITLDTIKNLPDILNAPAIILSSKNAGRQAQNTRLIVFGTIKADNGAPVLAVLDLRPVEKHLVLNDMQKVSSAYTKNNTATFLKSCNVLYAEKKKATALLKSVGFYMPTELQRNGFLGSISYVKRSVNMQSIPFMDLFSTQDEIAKPITQEVSSAKTSRRQIPALFVNKNVEFGKVNIDIGGGKYDLATEYLQGIGTKNLLFDPYNRGRDINAETLAYLQSGKKADTATCANVLNVISEEAARANVILEMAKAISDSGTAYFMVYEGDESGIGRETRDGFQNNRITADYVSEVKRYFAKVERKGKLIVATQPKANLPKAAWEVTPGEAVEYQQRQRGYTDVEVLEIAAEQVSSTDMNDAEKDALRIFQERLGKLRDMQVERQSLGQLYRQQQFGIDSEGNKATVDRSAAENTKRKMDAIDSRIEDAKNAVVKVEQAPALRRILKEARQVVENSEEERGQVMLKKYREQRNESIGKKKYRARVQQEADALRQMLMHPSNKNVVKHIPAVIQKSVADFISTIDFTSSRKLRGGDDTQSDARFVEQMTAMRNAIKSNIEFAGAYSGYADLPDGFMESFQAQIDHVQALIAEHGGEYVVNRMSASDLKDLSNTLRDLRRYIQDMNKFHNNNMFAHAYEAGEDSMQHLTKLGSAKGKKGAAYNFMAWQYMRPAFAFSRFGKGGESIYDEFRDGQAQQAFLAKEVIGFAEKTYTAKEVQEWSKDIKTFTIGGEEVSMPATAAMSFYCLYKRAQALTHIYGEGIRVANFKDGKYTYRDEGHALTPEEAQEIISSLSPRQVEVAKAIQQYMSTECAKWGNYVSMKRFATEVFGEEFYFPINSDGRHLQAEGEESPSNASLYALLNSSFSKELKENANNRLVLYNIFDVFANHAASMAQYRSFALPVLDALKWFNYRTDSGSLRDKMATAYGSPVEQKPGSGAKGYAEQFVLGILKAYNGTTARGDGYDSMGIRALHRFNRAQVAFNIRVVIQQPLAITRAAMILKPDKLAAGLAKSATQMKTLADEMEAHSGIAAWKSLGFYDTNISKGLTTMIKRDFTAGEKITDAGMKGAEVADRFTWAAMWSACKDTVARANFDTEAEYFEAVTKLFEQVIYKTQVVDSVLTKSEFLRSQSFFPRMAGAFMSEPSATVSLLTDAYFKYSEDIQRGMSSSEAWKRNSGNIGKTIAVYAIGQMLLAAAQAVADAWRDDDDYETFVQKYLQALKGNLVDETLPFGKVPFMSEFYDLSKDLLSKFGVDTYGSVASNGWMQYAQYLSKAVEIFADKAMGNNTKYTGWGVAYNLLRFGAGMTGYPIATGFREVIDVWNNTVGAIVPGKKIKTYDNSRGAQAYESVLAAYQQGHDTQVAEILSQIAANELEDGKSSQWEAENSVMSTLQSNVKSWFVDGKIDERTARGLLEYTNADIDQTILEAKGEIETGYDKSEAESAFIHGELEEKPLKEYFTKYNGMSASDADDRITKLRCERDTGVVYDHMKDMFLDGNITSSTVVANMQKYGGKEKDAAEATVLQWQCQKDTGIVYGEISDALTSKAITSNEAVAMLEKYGQKDNESAVNTVKRWEFIGTDDTLSDIKTEAVERYNSGCAPAGISKKQFYTAWSDVHDIFGDDLDGDGVNDRYTSMDKKFDYINSLPLTSAQKTALALAIVSSASESNIAKRAPW